MFTVRSIPKYQMLLEQAHRHPELDISSVEACMAFLWTSAEVYDAYDAHFASYGLSMGKFTVLMLLEHCGSQEMTPSDCAERLGVTRGTITGLLDGLERESLVKRAPHSGDRRMLAIQITQKGQQLLNEMLPEHYRRTSDLMSHLTEAERQTLIELLAKMRAGTPSLRSE